MLKDQQEDRVLREDKGLKEVKGLQVRQEAKELKVL